jgi:glycosyltransferase involved in cell wall biosynthesis
LFYHNVTPHHYWKNIDSLTAYHCLHGRAELANVVPMMNYGVAFSDFSLNELKNFGLTNSARIPLQLRRDLLEIPPDPLTLQVYRKSKERRILVVGRIVPNKMVDEAIRIVSMVPNSRLIVAGSMNSPIYYHAVRRMAAEAKIKCDFAGHTSQAELNALYKIADVMLVVSEHEGFCAPILEAFYFKIPVIAYSSAAVPETAGGGALLFDRKDPEMVAAMISRVLIDEDLRLKLQSEGAAVLKRYLEFPAREKFLEIIHEVSSMKPLYKLRKPA